MQNKPMREKKEIDWGLCFSVLVMFVAMFVMTKVNLGKEYNDFRTHSRWAVGEPLEPRFNKFYFYPVWHFCVRIVNWLLPIGREYSASLVTACFLGAAAALLYRFVKKELGKEWTVFQCSALTVSLLFVTALYMPWFNKEVYLGQSSPTIWHNPTNLAVKPVAFLIFLCFVKLYQERETVKNSFLIFVSGLLLFSCFIKPSFLQGFLPAVVLFLLLELIPNKGKSFLFSLKAALMFVPSGLYFIAQYLFMFDSEGSRSIGIEPFAVMRLDSPNPLVSILLGIAFPLLVLVFLGARKIFEDKALWLSVLFYLASLLEFVLFIEQPEAAAGNFEWALQLAMFLLFVMTAIRFYQMKEKKTWMRVAGNALLGYHVASGLWYYIWILMFSPWQC